MAQSAPIPRRIRDREWGFRFSPTPFYASTKDIDYHPDFQGVISKWVWRLWTHRFTPAGRWFIWITFWFTLFGSASLDLQTFAPFLYATALWSIAVIAVTFSKPRVRLTARHADRICAGAELAVDVDVEHTGRAPIQDLYLLPEWLPPPIDAVPADGVACPLLNTGETARLRLGLLCRERGVYVLKGFRVETDYPVGLLYAYRRIRMDRTLLVYPQYTPIAHMSLPTGLRYQPGGVALASNLGDSMEFLGNRDYQEGDNVRDIDWRAMARLNRPIVREYVQEYYLRVAVVLDTHIPKRLPAKQKARYRADFERAVSVSAAVSDYMSRSDYIVDIFAAGPNLYHLTAGRGLAYLDQILDILACVDESPEEPFSIIEPEILENLSRITTVICVLGDWDESRMAFVQRLRQGGSGVKVIVVRDGPCTLPPEGDAMTGPITVVDRAAYETGLNDL